jgi:hypothetical protein
MKRIAHHTFRYFYLLIGIGVLAGILSLGGCHGFFVDPILQSLSISPANPNLVVGATQQLTATGVNDDGSTTNNVTATWTSATPSVASITSGGLATALTAGTSTIIQVTSF